MATIYCDSSTKEACVVVEGRNPRLFPYLRRHTNNEGEYEAVLAALHLVDLCDLESAEIKTDSLLVVNQVNGTWQCRKNTLLHQRNKIREELSRHSNVTLSWIPREENLAGHVLG